MFRLKPITDLTAYRAAYTDDVTIPNTVTVQLGNRTVEACGPVLAYRSKVLEQMVTESANISIDGIQEEYVFFCLDILYGKEVRLEPDNLSHIYIFGQRFGVGEMCFTVEDFIENRMDVNEFWKYLIHAKDYFDETQLLPYFKLRADRSIERDYVDFYFDCKTALKKLCRDDADRGYLISFIVLNLDIHYLNVTTDYINDTDSITAREDTGISIPIGHILGAFEVLVHQDRLKNVNLDLDIFVRLFNLLNCKVVSLDEGRRFARIRRELIQFLPKDKESSKPDYNILTKKLVNYCTRSKTTEETILEFSKQSILPAYVVIEICLKWIALHRGVSRDTVKAMFDKASHLFIYYSLTTFQLKRFTKKPLTFYDIHPCDHDSMYIECQWHLYDPKSPNSMFKERPTVEDLERGIKTDDVVCWRHGKGCTHEKSDVGVTAACVFCCHFKNNDGIWYHCRSNRSPIDFTFRYVPDTVPQYEEQPHNEHWYLMCMYQDGKCYMYSFICGKRPELEELLKNSTWIKLHCVYRELS